MKTIPIKTLFGCMLLAGGCGRTPSPLVNQPNQPSTIQAEPFRGQIYKSLNGSKVLTLISKDECEMKESGTTYLCKYTKQNDSVRVVTTVLGTSQVLYFKMLSDAIEDSEGNKLYSPDGLRKILAEIQLRRQEDEKEAARQQMESERIAKAIADSKVESKALGAYPMAVRIHVGFNGYSKVERTLNITDVSLKWKTVINGFDGNDKPTGMYGKDHVVLFSDILNVYDLGKRDFYDIGGWNELSNDTRNETMMKKVFFVIEARSEDLNELVMDFDSDADANKAREAVLSAIKSWKSKFPEAIAKRAL